MVQCRPRVNGRGEMKINSKHNQIRVLGQRPISSSFISGSSNLGKDDTQKKGLTLNKDSSISFSDFLDQKLHTNPVPSKIVKGKSRPFRSPLGTRNDGGSTDHGIGIKEDKETNSVINQVIFEQFKHTNAEKGYCIGSYGSGDGDDDNDGEIGAFSSSIGMGSSLVSEIGTSNSNYEQETRKRRNPFQDGDEKHAIRKQSLVLGNGTEPKRKVRQKRFISSKKQRPLYNHYASGSGWWDCDMEGVDTEEVGFGEIWEGVGCTTFGGLEWH